MLDIQYIKYVFAKMGFIPDILMLGGGLYILILIVVLLYYLAVYLKRRLFG